MRIKKLEITGFKSFLDKTSLTFDAPITSIVGPNGCGKSNVVDALKWVTGELSFKELRGRSMEDLIFSGSELRPPTSMTEVALTLDNSGGTAPADYADYPEITVTRRIFRDGSSEFLINKVNCRLRDITDIFLDTGIGKSSYSIIEQGRVGAVVSSRPDDRRQMIEEAAGITKYKNRRQAAERKMEYTRQNLLRVNDVIRELTRQTNALERQARKAERYREIKDRAKTLDLSLLARNYATLHADVAKLGDEEVQFSEQEQNLDRDLAQKDASYEELKIQALEVEKDLEQWQEAIFQSKSHVQKLDSQITTARQQAEQLRVRAKEEEARSRELTEKLAAWKENLEKNSTEQEIFTQELSQLEAELNRASEQEAAIEENVSGIELALKEAKDRFLEVMNEDADIQKRVTTIDTKLSEIARLKGEKEDRLNVRQQELDNLEKQLNVAHRDLQAAEQLRFGFERNQEATKLSLEELHQKKEDLQHQRLTTSQTLEGKKARLATLEEFVRDYKGYGKGARSIMEKRTAGEGPSGEISGLLGETIHPQRGFERPVQAALSEMIECVLVGSTQDALSAIDYLKGNQLGRGSFLPRRENVALPNRELANSPGVRGWLTGFFDVDPRYHEATQALLGDVLLVDDLPTAVSLRKQGVAHAMVTMGGDRLSPQGVISGGDWEEERGILEIHVEVDELKEEITTLSREHLEAEQSYQQTEKYLQSLAVNLKEIETDLTRESETARVHEKEHHRLIEAVGHVRAAKEHLEEELAQWVREVASLEAGRVDIAQAGQAIVSSKASLVQTQDNLGQELETAGAKRMAQHEETMALKVREASLRERAEAFTREQEVLRTRCEDAQTEIGNLTLASRQHVDEAQELEAQTVTWSEEHQSWITRARTQEEDYSQRRSSYDELSLSLKSEEEVLRAIRRDRENFLQKVNDLRMKLQEHKLGQQRIMEQSQERYDVNLIDHMSQPEFVDLAEEDLTETRQELDELREKMAKIGNVHLGAIEELSDTKERCAFLLSQRDDLEESLNSLSSAIKKINVTTKERFGQTFEAVNERFRTIFPNLFRGGKAKLVLTDPENLLETGVEIVAQPPGKKLQNMNLLSGGEKALTAIALLFAIFEYKAPPFCVLDEVDAPLDDVNVGRFTDIVRQMSTQTQFIVITHNKVTMEVADNLYGVTMEEPGVSRTVSVRVNEVVASGEIAPTEAAAQSS